MACDAASPVSTREDTNYELLKHLLVGYGTRVLRNLFDEKIPPDELKDHLSREENIQIFARLGADGTLSARDLVLLKKKEPSSSSYDIQLLTKLLSCICDLSPPRSTGNWKRWPDRADESISAYIVRMRYYRNQIHGHETSTSMDDKQFQNYWKNISCAIIALAGREKERYTNEIRQLKQRAKESLETIQKLENLEGIVQSHINSTSAEFKEVKGMVQSHVNSTSSEFKEVKGIVQSHINSNSAEFKEVKGMVQSHVNSTSSEFKEVKGTLTANQERTEKLLQELLERGVTHRGAENTSKLSKDLK